jgi:hypothetical protein
MRLVAERERSSVVHNSKSLGKASLWTAIGELAFPVVLMVLAITVDERLSRWPYVLYGVPVAIVWMIALWCVIDGRNRKAKDGERRE